ncbi:MAG: hypothetical protein LBJ73_04575 [Rickettsiales bacterium]|jgi:5'(3')-deoxyribonucleotidase|nr:hypothetical protein [Rickettsiales bacterium]
MKLFFDMDNVLADFESIAQKYKVKGIEVNRPDSLLSAQVLDAKKEFWRRIEQAAGFWENLPKVANIDLLLTMAYEMGDMHVLSKAPSPKHFVGGQAYVAHIEKAKKDWIARHMGKFFPPENVIVSELPKERLIQPTKTDILIDDRPDNITPWLGAGGVGIVFKTADQAVKDLSLIKQGKISQFMR